MNEMPPKKAENENLLLLIDEWAADDESSWTYRKVCLELLNENTFLYFESAEVPAPIESFGPNEDPTMKMPFYTIEGERYFCAFTSSDLFGEFAAVIAPNKTSICLKIPAKYLLEAIDKSPMAGLIINTHSENVFVVFRQGER